MASCRNRPRTCIHYIMLGAECSQLSLTAAFWFGYCTKKNKSSLDTCFSFVSKDNLQDNVLSSLDAQILKSQVLPCHACTVRIHQLPLAALKCLQPRAAELCPVRLSDERCWRRVQGPHVCPLCGSLDLEQLLVSINSHLSSRLGKLCCYELAVRLRAKKREGHLPRPGIVLCQTGEHLFSNHTVLFTGCYIRQGQYACVYVYVQWCMCGCGWVHYLFACA